MLVYKYRKYSKPIDRINLENRPLTKSKINAIINIQEGKKRILDRKELRIDKIKIICYTIEKGNDTAPGNKKGY